MKPNSIEPHVFLVDIDQEFQKETFDYYENDGNWSKVIKKLWIVEVIYDSNKNYTLLHTFTASHSPQPLLTFR